MGKVDEILSLLKENKAVGKEEKSNTLVWVFAIIGVIVAIAGIAYVVYRYLTPVDFEDFEDDFENDFDEDFFEDDMVEVNVNMDLDDEDFEDDEIATETE